MKKLFLLPLLLAVAACSTANLQMPDKSKLVCAEEPGRPVGLGPNGAVTDDENGTYLRDLRSSGQDCRSNLQWVKDYLETFFAKKK